MIKQIPVEELKAKLDSGDKFVLVDCREPDEFGYCKINGAKNIPLSKFAELATKELSPTETIYIHCHHGRRSQQACEYLTGQGYNDVHNIAGGIEDWSVKIDPKVPRY